jgi:hypothetical protein
VVHIISFSFQGENSLIPCFLSEFTLVLLWQCDCPITVYLASIELTASFLSRCDAEVEAELGINI